MLDRLEHERRASARRALAAQEGARLRSRASCTTRWVRRSPASCCSWRAPPDRAHRSSREPAIEECGRRPAPVSSRCARSPADCDPAGARGARAAQRARSRSRPRVATAAGLRVRPRSGPRSRSSARARPRHLPHRAGVADERRAPRRPAPSARARRGGRHRHPARRDDGCGITEGGRQPPEGGSAGCRSARCSPAGRLRVVRCPSGGTEVRLRAGLGGRMTTPLTTRILLADDHDVVRRGLRWCSTPRPTWRSSPRSGTASRPSTARCAGPSTSPCSTSRCRADRAEAARELVRHRPDVRV